MKLEINEIKKVIRDAVSEYLDIQIQDDDKNLLSTDLHVIIPDFLYVLEVLEKQYGSWIYRLFEKNNYKVFSVNGLAQAILELSQEYAIPEI